MAKVEAFGAEYAHASRQNGSVSPRPLNRSWASAIVRRRQSGLSRSAYQACASAHAVGSEMIAPTRRPRAAHQRMTSSSDRKSRMVDQVKPISCHHEAAGTAKCTSPEPPASSCPVVRTMAGSPQSGQLGMISTGIFIMAEMPNASQAQLAHHCRPPAVTRNDVGMAENGMAIQTCRLPGSSTNTRAAARRSKLSRTAGAGAPVSPLTSSIDGAWPVRTNCW